MIRVIVRSERVAKVRRSRFHGGDDRPMKARIEAQIAADRIDHFIATGGAE